ncbi:hypothetical protein PINS_up024042 [Pythium insidiosum]|nr:hypothetical protein PINS_up024042 [Pythium insidiosum]
MLDGTHSHATNCAHYIRQTLPRWLHERRASFTLRFYLATLLSSPPQYQQWLDVPSTIVEAIARCEGHDLTAITRWLQEATVAVGIDRQRLPRVTSAVDHFLALTELWPSPSPTQAELDAVVASTRVTDGFLAAQLTPHCALLAKQENATTCADARPLVAGVESHVRPALRAVTFQRPALRLDAPMDWGNATNLLLFADPRLFDADARYAEELYRQRLSAQPLSSPASDVAVVRSDVENDRWPLDRDRDVAAIVRLLRMEARGLRGVWDIGNNVLLDGNVGAAQNETSHVLLERVTVSGARKNFNGYGASYYPTRSPPSMAQMLVLVVFVAIGLVLIDVMLTAWHKRRIRQRTAAAEAAAEEEQQPLATR